MQFHASNIIAYKELISITVTKMNRFYRLVQLLMVFSLFFFVSCTKDDTDSIEQDKNEWMVSKIDVSSLNGWDNGYIINNNMYLCESTDSRSSEIIGIIGCFDYFDDNIVITANNGYLQTICTSSETFYFTYDETGVRVLVIDDTGDVEELIESQSYDYDKKVTTRADNNTNTWLGQIQDFLNDYADRLSTSDSRFIRDQAENIRNFPKNLIEDGLVTGIAKLTGMQYLPFLSDILDKIGKYDDERSIFGNCMMAISGVSQSDASYFINANLTGFESMPNYGELSQSVTGGVVCRYTKALDTWNKPTTSYNDYKWEHNYTGNSNLIEELPKMNLGWYEFRSYVTKAGITKYGNSYSYLYSDIDETPTYIITNANCTYIGDDKFRVEFDCSFTPLNNDGLLYQGIQMNLKNGDMLTSFGVGSTTEKISKIVTVDNFTISGTSAVLNIDVQFWYVTRYSSETFFKDLEPNSSVKYEDQPSIKFTSAQINGTSIIEYNEDNGNHYETKYSFEYEATGTYWIDYIQYTIVQDNWNNYWEPQRLNGDGSYSASGNSKYWTTSTASHQSYYTIYLKHGGIIQSSNSLSFSGNPISSVSISGSSSMSSFVKTNSSISNKKDNTCWPTRIYKK